MHVIVRIARVVVLLLLVIAVPLILVSVGGRFIGSRVYIVNNTGCRVVVMEEHDGYDANPGESVLIKSGLVDSTPTMMILAGSTVWFRGLHFSNEKLRMRGQDDILIPHSLLRTSLIGSTLTYELTANGLLQLKLQAGDSSASQPLGFPLKVNPLALTNGCGNG